MILAVLQARFSSTRLPGKVLKPILGRPMLAFQVERVERCKRIDRLVVATSTDGSDDAIDDLCRKIGVDCFRGSLGDVLDRVYRAALGYNPEHVVRLTGDCPLADPEVIDGLIEFYLEGCYDYASNTLEPTFPDGLDAEVMRFSALEEAWKRAVLPSEREHVTPFIYKMPGRFKIGNFRRLEDLSYLRWTVDEPEDFELVRQIYEALYPSNPDFSAEDVLGLIRRAPLFAEINKGIGRNQGLKKSEEKDREFLAEGRGEGM